jgi:hypothetical protein
VCDRCGMRTCRRCMQRGPRPRPRPMNEVVEHRPEVVEQRFEVSEQVAVHHHEQPGEVMVRLLVQTGDFFGRVFRFGG